MPSPCCKGRDTHARANLVAGRDVEPAFSWGFFDRLLLIVTERVGELVVVFGDQTDIALVLDRGDRRLQSTRGQASASPAPRKFRLLVKRWKGRGSECKRYATG